VPFPKLTEVSPLLQALSPKEKSRSAIILSTGRHRRPEGISAGMGAVSMGRVGFLIYKDHVIMCGDVINSARCWARRGYDADVFSIDTGRFPPPALGDEGVRFPMTRTLYTRLFNLGQRLKGSPREEPRREARGEGDLPSSLSLRGLFVRAGAALLGLLQPFEFIVAATVRLLSGRYDLVIACDTPSLVAARIAHLLKGIPFVFHSRELLLSWDLRTIGERLEKFVERRCHRRAAFTVIQDSPRAGLLARDNTLSPERFLIVPNAPLGMYRQGPAPSLAERLGLAPGTAAVLYAGTVDETTMILEVVKSVSRWPEATVLVIHGNIETTYRPLLEEAAAAVPGRVVFSPGTIQTDELDRFFAGAAAGLAFYRPINDNFRYVGRAAGKIFNYMKVGCPAICNNLPGLRELLDDQGCGRTVADPSMIGEALEEILGDHENYRRHCIETFGRYEFSVAYGTAIDRMESVIRGSGGPKEAPTP
jgi:glycosyltransferase involved in cell wall biosynthesis